MQIMLSGKTVLWNMLFETVMKNEKFLGLPIAEN